MSRWQQFAKQFGILRMHFGQRLFVTKSAVRQRPQCVIRQQIHSGLRCAHRLVDRQPTLRFNHQYGYPVWGPAQLRYRSHQQRRQHKYKYKLSHLYQIRRHIRTRTGPILLQQSRCRRLLRLRHQCKQFLKQSVAHGLKPQFWRR